jgi:effector-binding domain-containing protein
MSDNEMAISQIPIGKFSLITTLTPKALRFYDKKGILVPEEKDPITGYRYYTITQVETAIKIKTLSWLGFNLDEIPQLLSAAKQNDVTFIQAVFSKKLAATQLEIQRLRKVEEILLSQRNTIELIALRTTEPVVKEVPPLRLLSRREVGSFNLIPQFVGEIIQEIVSPDNQRNMARMSGPVMYICHDTEFKEGEGDFEIGVPITGRITIQSSKIELKNIPGGRVVSAIYAGAYKEIAQGYMRTYDYAFREGHEIRGPTMELYLNNPQETPEEDLLTEIQIPIK